MCGQVSYGSLPSDEAWHLACAVSFQAAPGWRQTPQSNSKHSDGLCFPAMASPKLLRCLPATDRKTDAWRAPANLWPMARSVSRRRTRKVSVR